ncbi:hypothetical protein [Microbacterium esteraromaticum]|uniref:hypothetical protein n=1 Tax=Microbacterium esteraromaticum TaxID=57043 RepID=UPI0019D32CC0|nr:hypothetical protein [Microbacterium esteraromaticum]MBN7792404.1 hypothetical protein [Microbacterium esteraromaticum]
MDAAALIVNIGLLIATGGATAIAWRGAISSSRSETKTEAAQNAAVSAASSARRQADAAEHSSLAARRQAEAAESALTQSDSHRADDREADAILGLVSMLYREVELASAFDLWTMRAFHRFSNGERLVRAYTLLPVESHPVARWSAARRDAVMKIVDRAQGDIASGGVGRHQSHAAQTAEDAAQELLKWRRGERDTASFEAEL